MRQTLRYSLVVAQGLLNQSEAGLIPAFVDISLDIVVYKARWSEQHSESQQYLIIRDSLKLGFTSGMVWVSGTLGSHDEENNLVV